MTYLPPVSANLYPTGLSASGISGYYQLAKPPVSAASEVDTSQSLDSGDGEVLLRAFVSPALGLTSIDAGTWTFRIYGNVDTVDGTNEIVIRVYKRTSGGTETELFNTTTGALTATAAGYTITESESEFSGLSITDRLVVKFLAKTGSAGTRTIHLYTMGAAHQSRLSLPVELAIVTGGDMLASLYDSDLDGAISGGGSAGNWILLADSLLASDAANIDFASISGSYKHLMLIYSLRSDYAANNDALKVAVNNDTGNNYDIVRFSMGHDKNAATAESYGTSPPNTVAISGNTSTANYFAQGIIYFNDYANTGIYKPFNVKGGNLFAASAGLMYIRESFGVWRSTNAINRLTFAPVNGSNFKQYSRMSLYGLS